MIPILYFSLRFLAGGALPALWRRAPWSWPHRYHSLELGICLAGAICRARFERNPAKSLSVARCGPELAAVRILGPGKPMTTIPAAKRHWTRSDLSHPKRLPHNLCGLLLST